MIIYSGTENISLFLPTLWSARHILKFPLFRLMSDSLISQAAMRSLVRLQSEQKFLMYMRTQKAQNIYSKAGKK